jgi:hypothetical protein
MSFDLPPPRPHPTPAPLPTATAPSTHAAAANPANAAPASPPTVAATTTATAPTASTSTETATGASTAPASSGPDDRATSFQAVEGGTEQHSGTTLMVEAYSALWVLLMGWIFLLWRKQAALNLRLDGLENAIDQAAAEAEKKPEKS